MPEISADVVALLEYLAPGFLVAAIQFAMTSHTKPSQFERLVQALLYTTIIRALVAVENLAFIGPWTSDIELITSLGTALGLGLLTAIATNHDIVYVTLRRLGLTTRTAHPCEWFGVFSDHSRFVTLQLKDGSRIGGWPDVWPADAKAGHFFITEATRTVDGVCQELAHLEGILVNAEDVVYVEFAASQD